ncbi:hypothetical protein ACP70R_009396 [Stipagrostis hirtigluma subsp. patula]
MARPPAPTDARPPASGRYVSKRERALLAASRPPVDSVSLLPSPATAVLDSQ